MAIKANYFAALPDIEVFILTTEQKNNQSCYKLDPRVKLIDLGIDYERNRSYFSSKNILKAIKHFFRQRKLLAEYNPDVIISPNYNFDHFWLPFIHRTSKKIKERHGSRYFESEQRKSAGSIQKLKFYFNDYIDGKYTNIVVLNDDEKKYVKSGNAVVIPNPIEIPDYESSLLNKKVIAAGRIAPVKAFDELIMAWEIIKIKHPDWNLDIYGDNYQNTQEELQNLIDDLRLQDVVHFQKTVSDLQEKLLDYSIYAMSSETECFPMVLLEALSVGVPVVSYDCPNGPRNIITNNSDGLLVKNRKIDDLAENIIILINDSELRMKMGKRAKLNIERFSIDKVMKKWISLIHLDYV